MYQEKIEAIENKITRLEQEQENLIREWAEKHHPLKIGDKVIINGFSHKGKMMKVDHISVNKRWKIWKWRAVGKVIKKNGDVGIKRDEWSCPVEGEDKI